VSKVKEQFRVLITGQNRGLGAALAKKFKDNGHYVMYHGGQNHINLANMTDLLEFSEEAKNNRIDVLINNAAIVCPSIELKEYTPEKIEKMISVNLTAPILLSSILVEQLKHIVNINSMVGLEIKSPRTLYSATKWGLRGFSNSLKKENSNIKVLDVYPTNIKTTPDRENAMELDYVVNKIYNSFIEGHQDLILDGRKL
jgi:short-subunit dehydrogenase